jgi:hypothetical protein
VYAVERIVIDLTAGKRMQPSGLCKEPAEKQNAQKHNDGDYDDLDQTHNESLKVREKRDENRAYSKIVRTCCQ